MQLYEWMVQPTTQTEWIEKRGILLWLAFFFIELGAGIYFVASLVGNVPGMTVGWLVCGVLGGGLHLLYLGQPTRFYRMFARPQSSWISRGMIFVTGLLSLGFFNIFFMMQDTRIVGLQAATIILAFLVVIYGGFAMCRVNGIALWNTALLPVLYVASGLWGGAGVTMLITVASGFDAVGLMLEKWGHLLFVSFAVLLCTYLLSMNYGVGSARASLIEIIKGKGGRLFWIVVVAVGMGIPILLLAAGLGSISVGTLSLVLLCELAGDLSMRYLILKYGFYSPLIPSHI